MKKYAIFDMDGTLADATARQHHLQKEPQDWEAFFGDLHMDPPIADIVTLYNTIAAAEAYELAIFTGRPERYKKMTQEWMARHGLAPCPIYCRPDNDNRHDLDVKRDMYLDFVSQGREVAFIVEDRNSVVAMWREMGITCLHCRDADF